MENWLPLLNERLECRTFVILDALFIHDPVKEINGARNEGSSILESDTDTCANTCAPCITGVRASVRGRHGMGVVGEVLEIGDGVGRCEFWGEAAAAIVVAINCLMSVKNMVHNRNIYHCQDRLHRNPWRMQYRSASS